MNFYEYVSQDFFRGIATIDDHEFACRTVPGRSQTSIPSNCQWLFLVPIKGGR